MSQTLDNIFFVFGPPKTGTTWVQQLLNAHPDITCHAKQHTQAYLEKLIKINEEYNLTVQRIDDRTAQQGTIQYTRDDIIQQYRFAILLLLSKGGTKLRGFKDNSIINVLNIYKPIFPAAKYIYVLRDPRDVAVSSWFHNQRVDDGFLDDVGSLDNWCAISGKTWRLNSQVVDVELGEDNQNLKIIKYEDLKSNPRAIVPELLDFLGAERNLPIVAQMIENTAFEKQQATGNEFFRSGQVGDWKNHLTDSMVDAIWEECGEHAEWYGYEK